MFFLLSLGLISTVTLLRLKSKDIPYRTYLPTQQHLNNLKPKTFLLAYEPDQSPEDPMDS